MAKSKQSNLEKYRMYAQQFTVGMAILYAVYWAILSITNTAQTGRIHVLGNVLLVTLSVGGVIMGLLFAAHERKK